jgi:hypothetical protein
MKSFLMKFFFPLLLLLTPLLTRATIQITVTAEIAPQLSLESYILVQSGALYLSGNCGDGPWNYSVSYAFSETYAGGTNLDFSGNSQGGYVGGWGCFPCGAIIYVGPLPKPPLLSTVQATSESGTGLVLNGGLQGATIIGTTTAGTNAETFTNTDVNLQWGWENAHYAASVPLPLQNGSENISRTVVTILKLQTGGPAGSKLHNVFGMNASIQQVAPAFPELCGGSTPDPATICEFTVLTNGPFAIQTNWLQVFPDNANEVISPPNFNLNDYKFSLSTAKYHSYLELFTEAASSSDVTLGHGFWRLSTEAPTNGPLNAFPFVSATWLQFLNHCEGFYPDHNNDYYGHPGILQNDDGQLSYINLQRKFYISFPNLIAALGATYQAQASPPNYDLVGWNCVNQACDIAFIAGMDESILNPQTPAQMTDYLTHDYPGPWLNNSEIYYPLP